MKRIVFAAICTVLLSGCHHRTVMLNMRKYPDTRQVWEIVCVQEKLFEHRPILAESDRICPKHQNAVLVPAPDFH